jgi:primosomal protein N' (replication factor Y)
MNQPLVRVAVPVPLAQSFDYIWAGTGAPPGPGCRVSVPFGRGSQIGVVVEHPPSSTIEAHRLKPVNEVLDDSALIDAHLLALLNWASQYYRHPLGEVIAAAMPKALRQGKAASAPPPRYWQLTAAGSSQDLTALAGKAPRQALALQHLGAHTGPTPHTTLRDLGISTATLERLCTLGFVVMAEPPSNPVQPTTGSGPELTPNQAIALKALGQTTEFNVTVLFGVTGSGKTEVYLRLIEQHLNADAQTLMLVPEISLTPQMVARLTSRFGSQLAVMHSGLADGERLAAWRRARDGTARVIVGTRSAVFTGIPRLGLIIIDEEHDSAYKQQDGFRYSARDLAVMRARMLNIPIVLGSATPSLESLANVQRDRYQLVELSDRIGSAGTPALKLIDLNHHPADNGLSQPLLAAIEQHLSAGNQTMLFLNRRGFAPALFCPTCAAAAQCSRCDANLTLHAALGRMRCHHCGSDRPLSPPCPTCGTERIAVGEGTQRIEERIAARFPNARVARLDRDATQRKGKLNEILSSVTSGKIDILVGTQMLTKGHDFPNVTLVGVLNADQGLFGTDFRAPERLAQTIVQVAGRAGRGTLAGEVLIQTYFPHHPLLQCLLEHGYPAFAEMALAERNAAGWPPFGRLVLLRADSHRREDAENFLVAAAEAARHSPQTNQVTVLGPAPAVMERRAGRYRHQLILLADTRAPLDGLFAGWLAELQRLPTAKRVRYSLDVDPIEL